MSTMPVGWHLKPLMEIIDLHDSHRVPLNHRERAERKGEYPYYGANGQVDSIDGYLLDGEYILLAEDGGYFDQPSRGVAYEVSGKFWVNNHAHILAPKDGVPRRLLTYALNSFDWMPYVGGSTRLKLTQEGMKRVKIPLPPSEIQHLLVAKLDTLFASSRAAREELVGVPRLVQRYKQAILAAAFRGDLTEDWRRLNEISSSETWQELPLGNLALDVRYGTSAKCHYEPKATPVLRIPNVAGGRIDTTDLKYAAFGKKEIEKLAIQPGDLLVIRSNGSLSLVGRASLATQDVAGFLFAGYLIRLRFNHDRIDPNFAVLAFEEPSLRASVERLAKSTSGVNNINSEQLKALRIQVPSLAEQGEVVTRVQESFARIDTLAAETKSAFDLLDRLDRAALAKAFRGELVGSSSTLATT